MAQTKTKPPNTIKILFYNIRAGTQKSKHIFSINSLLSYLKSNQKNLKEIEKNISKLNPDIIGMVEIDNGSFRTKNQTSYFAKNLKMHSISACKYGWESKLPFLKHQVISLFSKHKILSTIRHKYSVGLKRLALETILKFGSSKISIITTHLSLGEKIRKIQIKELKEIIKNCKNNVIVMGDFNKDNLKLSNLHTPEGNTFPSWKAKKQLDYIFSNLPIKKFKILPWKESDHLPIYAEIKLPAKKRKKLVEI